MRMDSFERKAMLMFDVIGTTAVQMMEGVEMMGRGEEGGRGCHFLERPSW